VLVAHERTGAKEEGLNDMPNNNGWLPVLRKNFNHKFWKQKRVFSLFEAWIDILQSARYNETPGEVLIGYQTLTCHQGECLYSLDTWAARWNWNKSRVRRFFKLLQKENLVRIKSEQITTRLTVVEYPTSNNLRHSNDTQVTRKRHANDTQTTPTEEREKREKSKKEKKTAESSDSATPPPKGKTRKERIKQPDPLVDLKSEVNTTIDHFFNKLSMWPRNRNLTFNREQQTEYIRTLVKRRLAESPKNTAKDTLKKIYVIGTFLGRDDFWSGNCQTIGKLLRLNKDKTQHYFDILLFKAMQ